MSAQWKPGDVAMVGIKVGLRVEYSPFACPKTHAYDGDHWHRANDWIIDDAKSRVRPLVVIDPEDYEQVERLFRAYATTAAAIRTDAMQAALREFADPKPKIEEPTGSRAIIRDRNGDEWIQVRPHIWRSITSPGRYKVEKHWDDSDAPLRESVVQVLSEGSE